MHALVLFILKKVFYFHNDYPYILHKLNVSWLEKYLNVSWMMVLFYG